jgi:carbamoyl-phosphate synthase large subunit
VFFCKTAEEFLRVKKTIGIEANRFIVQEYIEGDEYTCGSVTLDGICKGVIVMRRILRDGDTHKCFVEKNAVIEDTVRKAINELKPFGACNVQLRMRDGEPYVFEINARCSGTTASRTLCGFNEPLMIADFLLKGKGPIFSIEEKTILRYWKELVVDNDRIDCLALSGNLKSSNLSSL